MRDFIKDFDTWILNESADDFSDVKKEIRAQASKIANLPSWTNYKLYEVISKVVKKLILELPKQIVEILNAELKDINNILVGLEIKKDVVKNGKLVRTKIGGKASTSRIKGYETANAGVLVPELNDLISSEILERLKSTFYRAFGQWTYGRGIKIAGITNAASGKQLFKSFANFEEYDVWKKNGKLAELNNRMTIYDFLENNEEIIGVWNTALKSTDNTLEHFNNSKNCGRYLFDLILSQDPQDGNDIEPLEKEKFDKFTEFCNKVIISTKKENGTLSTNASSLRNTKNIQDINTIENEEKSEQTVNLDGEEVISSEGGDVRFGDGLLLYKHSRIKYYLFNVKGAEKDIKDINYKNYIEETGSEILSWIGKYEGYPDSYDCRPANPENIEITLEKKGQSQIIVIKKIQVEL